jgi:hypothetical protein
MGTPPQMTPGLRVSISPVDSGMYQLAFGRYGERRELVSTAQLMTLVVDGAGELGLILAAPPPHR